ncbi:unnamed protein product [Boreogadus saida]
MKTFGLVFVFLILAAVYTGGCGPEELGAIDRSGDGLAPSWRGPRPGGAINGTRRTHDDNEDNDDEESKTSAHFYVGLFPCRPISSDSL